MVKVEQATVIMCPEAIISSPPTGIMTEKTTSERTSQKTKRSFQFKAVSFGDSTQNVQQLTLPQRAEMPFIITQNGKNSSHDQTRIKRTVMQDFVSKEKNQIVRRSRKARVREQNERLPQRIRPRGSRDREYRTEVVDETQSSGSISLSKAVESQGYSLIDNRTLISFDNGASDPVSANSQVDVDGNPPSLLGPLGAGRVDPFGTYPIPNTWLNNQLLDHCNPPFFVFLSSSCSEYCSRTLKPPLIGVTACYELKMTLVIQT